MAAPANTYELRYKQTSFDLETIANSEAIKGHETRINLLGYAINQIADNRLNEALISFLIENRDNEIGKRVLDVFCPKLEPLIQRIKDTRYRYLPVESPVIEGYTEERDDVEGDHEAFYEIRFRLGESALIFEEHDRKLECEGKEDVDDLTPVLRYEEFDQLRAVQDPGAPE